MLFWMREVSEETLKDDEHGGCANTRAEQGLLKICVLLARAFSA